MGGITDGSWASENAGASDFAAVALDIGTPAGVSFNVVPSQTEDRTNYPFTSPSPSTAPSQLVSTAQPSKQMAPAPSTTKTDTNPPVSGPTSAPTTVSHRLVPAATTSWPTHSPTSTLTTGGVPYNSNTVAAVLSSTLAFFVAIGVLLLYFRQRRRTGGAVVDHVCDRGDGHENQDGRAIPPASADVPTQHSGTPRHIHDSFSSLADQTGTVTEGASLTCVRTIPKMPATDERATVSASLYPNTQSRESSGVTPDAYGMPEGHMSSSPTAAKGGTRLPPVFDQDYVDSIAEIGDSKNSCPGGCRKPIRGFGVTQAVMGAAHDLAQMSQIAGVSEVAGLVVVLMKLVTDNSDNVDRAENMVKRCRSVVTLLQRAERVLQYVSGSVIDDVYSAVNALRLTSETIGALVSNNFTLR